MRKQGLKGRFATLYLMLKLVINMVNIYCLICVEKYLKAFYE